MFAVAPTAVARNLFTLRNLQEEEGGEEYDDPCSTAYAAIEACVASRGSETCTEECFDSHFGSASVPEEPFQNLGPDITSIDDITQVLNMLNGFIEDSYSIYKQLVCGVGDECCPNCLAEIQSALQCEFDGIELEFTQSYNTEVKPSLGLLVNLLDEDYTIPDISANCNIAAGACKGANASNVTVTTNNSTSNGTTSVFYGDDDVSIGDDGDYGDSNSTEY